MKKLILFFTIRVLDLLTTKLAMAKYGYGWTSEGNPFYSYLIKNNSYLAVIAINLFISTITYLIFTRIRFLRKWLKVVIGGMGLVVIWNFVIYVLI